MMKIFFLIVLLVMLACAYLAFASYTAKPPQTGLVSDKLRPCSSKPNCVSSEETGEKYVAPVVLSTDSAEQSWSVIRAAVESTGGAIKQQEGNYLWAEYRSRWFRFTDDLELRLDQPNKTLYLRSGSRAGTSDFGVNRKRVEGLRQVLAQSPQ